MRNDFKIVGSKLKVETTLGKGSLIEFFDEIILMVIEDVVIDSDFCKTKAAKRLGISRTTLVERLRKNFSPLIGIKSDARSSK